MVTDMNNAAATRTVDGTDGRVYEVDALTGKVLSTWHVSEEQWEGPTCSVCDAVGHGYGGIPCPLEDRGWRD